MGAEVQGQYGQNRELSISKNKEEEEKEDRKEKERKRTIGSLFKSSPTQQSPIFFQLLGILSTEAPLHSAP